MNNMKSDLSQADLGNCFNLIDTGTFIRLRFCFIDTFWPYLWFSDGNGTINKTELSDFKERFEAGEFEENKDGPWAVYYDGHRNRYIFNKHGRKSSSVGSSPKGSSIASNFEVPTDDGLAGKPSFEICIFEPSSMIVLQKCV